MAVARSPFVVIQNFLSPKLCETIIDNLGFYTPDKDETGAPMKMYRHHEGSQEVIFQRWISIVPNISTYYDVEYRGTESMVFEFFAPGTMSEPLCENSNYIHKKWTRMKDRDFTALVFLSDYNESEYFDSDFEVYGGKLEFPQHDFGFNPERGTLIVYPSCPHFINATAPVLAGELFQVRFHMATKLPYLYDPRLFPGDYRSWFTALDR